jgi:HAD superfamily hydrolase (TIGR01549 family)
MIRNIIWDVGGTLFDTYPAMTAAFLGALNEEGIAAPVDQVRSLAQVSQKHCAQILSQIYNLDEGDFWQRYKRRFEETPAAEQQPFPGVREVCERICTLGGVNLIATHRARGLVEQLLEVHRLSQLFAGILTTSDGYPRKPDPTMLNTLVVAHHLDRAQTLAIGDREIDITAGKAAILQTCLLGKHDIGTQPDMRIDSYAELLEKLRTTSEV